MSNTGSGSASGSRPPDTNTAPGAGANNPLDAGEVDSGTSAPDASATESDAGMPQVDASAPDGSTVRPDRGAPLANLDAHCGNISGRDVLALLQPSYSSTFAYDGGERSPTPLTIQVNYDGGEISCAQEFCPCDPPPPPATCQPCSRPPWIYVDLTTSFRTADGSFDEQFVGTATYIPDNGDLIDLEGSVSAANLKGTLTPLFGPTESVGFGITLNGSRTTGVVSEGTARHSAGGGSWWGAASLDAVNPAG